MLKLIYSVDSVSYKYIIMKLIICINYAYEINIMNLMFTKIFRFMWFLFFVLFIFLDRDITFNKIFLISFIVLLATITIFRILDSRDEWRKIVKEEENLKK